MICMGLYIVVSIFAAMVLAAASADSDVESLLERFRAVDWNKREVGQNKDLADNAWKVRIEVEHELIALGKSAVPKLIETCRDSNQHVRLLAAYVLGCLNDRSAIPALMQIVSSDSYAPARLAAVEALGRLGAKEALSLVQAATEDKSSYVRNAAAWALPRVMKGEEVGDALQKIAKSNFDKSQIATAVVGKAAPDFSLMADTGETVRLSDFRGKKPVVLVFMLADW